MKRIKLKVLGFWPGFSFSSMEYHPLCKAILQNFEIEESETPDFLLCSVFGLPYEYCRYDCVRILFSGENYSPDFSLFDYAIGHDAIAFGDRYCQYAGYNQTHFGLSLENKNDTLHDRMLFGKPYFCNFIYRNRYGQREREEMFHLLSRYKRVESAGEWLNNMPGGDCASSYEKKFEILKKSKFTIAIESLRQPDFITEKINHAFVTNTIPIYLGAPNIEEIFNPRAFVNCGRFGSLEAAVQRVIQLDNDDGEYLKMLREPALNDPGRVSRNNQQLEEFICHIFSQDPEQAFRRSRVFSSRAHNDRLAAYSKTLRRKARLKRLPYDACRHIWHLVPEGVRVSLRAKYAKHKV